MFLRETPYIKISNSGRIDYTSARIKEFDGDANSYLFSYSTIIGIYTTDPDTGRKLYLKNAYSYSTTTATKHHPRGAAIADYNNYEIIEDIKPEILNEIYHHPDTTGPELIRQVIKEDQDRQQLKKYLSLNLDNRKAAYAKLKIHKLLNQINQDETDEKTIYYKNGNQQKQTRHRTNFQTLYNFQYKIVKHYFKNKKYTGPTPPGGLSFLRIGKYYIKTRTVVYSY